jgi:hypothetical protein
VNPSGAQKSATPFSCFFIELAKTELAPAFTCPNFALVFVLDSCLVIFNLAKHRLQWLNRVYILFILNLLNHPLYNFYISSPPIIYLKIKLFYSALTSKSFSLGLIFPYHKFSNVVIGLHPLQHKLISKKEFQYSD